MADKPPCSIAECIHQWGTKKLSVETGMRKESECGGTHMPSREL